ncbi:hypothetical protein BJV82DRAFT_525993 [Fennellomyces sp. T-0311]|nr:hypothetical protein BJV82DRAFT_525993 [Fennellomyces sp. T-0311]
MYQNWDHKATMVVTRLKWYRVEDIVKFAQDVCNYILTTAGKPSECYAPKLPGTVCPAEANRQFPPNELYICEGIGDWSYRINILLLSLSMVVHTNKLQRKYPNIETPGEAELTLLATAAEVLIAVEQMQDIVDRGMFERRYSLRWQETN